MAKLTRDEVIKGLARLDRGFMTPSVWQESVWVVETRYFTEYVLASLVGPQPTEEDLSQYVEGEIETFELTPDAWCAQLSASGYMDQTDLTLHATREAAEAYLVETYRDEQMGAEDAEDQEEACDQS